MFPLCDVKVFFHVIFFSLYTHCQAATQEVHDLAEKKKPKISKSKCLREKKGQCQGDFLHNLKVGAPTLGY